jgi:hypothetical protein
MPEESVFATDVADELHREPAIHAVGISVSASDGIIVLAGNVDSYREKDLAEHAALQVKGVRAVANEITHLVCDRIRDLRYGLSKLLYQLHERRLGDRRRATATVTLGRGSGDAVIRFARYSRRWEQGRFLAARILARALASI